MASSIPYDPEAFDANPFAQESSLSSSTWESSNPSSSPAPDTSIEHNQSLPPAPDSAPVVEPSTATPIDGTDAIEPTSAPAPIDPLPDQLPLPSQDQQQSQPPPTSDQSSTQSPVKAPKKKYKLILKVTALERQGKKDSIIKFDAYTTLPRFRTTTFRDIRRTHGEFAKFGAHLNNANSECFVPTVPPATTSAGTGTEEDELRILKNIQLWLDRVSNNPILARDEEFVHFIESDFGYSPVYKKKPPATGMARKALKQLQPPHDEVTELAEFRPTIKQLYLTGQETVVKIEKVSKARRHLGLALNDFGSKLNNFSATEIENPNMVTMWRKFGKIATGLGDLEAVKATTEAVTLGDGLNWIIKDAYSAKEALTNRHLLMRELAKAQAVTKARHQTAVKLRGSTNINPPKVDEAISLLDEAVHAEEQLTNKVRRVTENMLIEKKILQDRIETDIRSYISDYVVRLIDSERRALSAWESIRTDVRAADANGGLSRLGREAHPTRRRPSQVQSQGVAGDAWSGDRKLRAKDLADTSVFYPQKDSALKDGEDDSEEDATDSAAKPATGADGEPTQVDARSAASLLAGSTF